MDPLKSLPFGVILRNFLAGIFFLGGLVIILGMPEDVNIFKDISSGAASLAAMCSLAVGTAVYAVQRALWIPVIEHSFFRKLTNENLEDLPFITKEGFDIMISRWAWGAEVNKTSTIEERYTVNLATWADYIHFMFSSSFCLIVGLALGFSIMKDAIGLFATFAFLTLMSAGVFSDRYRRYAEEDCRTRINKHRKH